MTRDEPQGFEFPCEYEIKAMGLDEGGFDRVVIDIIRRHSDRVREDSVRLRASRGGKYVSVSVVIEAESRTQLDAIYDALTAHEKVLMRL
jgi:putative lipoic acid-binding regulatory protein